MSDIYRVVPAAWHKNDDQTTGLAECLIDIEKFSTSRTTHFNARKVFNFKVIIES